MPIHNRIYPIPPAGAIGQATLQLSGPIVQAEVAIPSALEQTLRQTNQPVAAPARGMALIDTGAGISAVDDSVIRSLGVSPIGLTTVGTAGGSQQQNLYPARFILPELSLVVEFSMVLGSNLSGQGIHALIGRDVLSRMVLVYNGPIGHVILAY